MTRRDAKTVLLADDDHDLVNALAVRCRRMGLKVLTAHDAFTALALVRSKCPDLICLDVEMPAGNGLSVCEMLTSDATGRNIPIVIMTGRSDSETITRCHTMCAYYVEKCADIWSRIEPLLRELLSLPTRSGAEGQAASLKETTATSSATDATREDFGISMPLFLSPSIPSPPIIAPVSVPSLDSVGSTNAVHREQRSVCKSIGSVDAPHDGVLNPAMPEMLATPTERHAVANELEEGEQPPSVDRPRDAASGTPSSNVWRNFSKVMSRVVGRAAAQEETAAADGQDAKSPTNIETTSTAPSASENSNTVSVHSFKIGELPAAVPDLDKVWSQRGANSDFKQPSKRRLDEIEMPNPASSPTEKTVLIADDDVDLVQMLVLRCTQLGLRVFRSPDAMHALLGVHRVRPDLLILDVNMPGGNGLSVCEMLASDESLNKIPVIIMTADANEEIPQRCQMLGAQFLAKSAGLWEQLEPLIRRALGLPDLNPPSKPSGVDANGIDQDNSVKILCIDDDPEISKILKLRLEKYGIDVLRAFNGMQGYWTALDMRPNLIILDMVMPDGGGNYIFGRLKAHPLTQNTPVLMLTGVNTPGVRRQMFGMGVDAYLTKPIDFEALLEHVRQYVPLLEPSKPASDDIADRGIEVASESPKGQSNHVLIS